MTCKSSPSDYTTLEKLVYCGVDWEDLRRIIEYYPGLIIDPATVRHEFKQMTSDEFLKILRWDDK